MSTESVPAARRARRPGWRDPRIVGGVLIMAASVVIGGWAMGARGGSRPVLVVSHDVVSGAAVSGTDVTVRRVRVDDGDLGGRYFTSAGQLPHDAHLTHALRAGELLPRSALEADTTSGQVEVPLAVAPEDLPSTVRAGSSVDVWVLPDRDRGQADPGASARRVLQAVSVLRISGAGTSLAPQDTRQVIVTLPADRAGGRLAPALAEIAAGRVLITRRG